MARPGVRLVDQVVCHLAIPRLNGVQTGGLNNHGRVICWVEGVFRRGRSRGPRRSLGRGWSAWWAGGLEGCPALVNCGLDGGLSEYLRSFGGVVEGVDNVVLNGGHPDDRLVALGPRGQALEGKLSFSLVGDIVESWRDAQVWSLTRLFLDVFPQLSPTQVGESFFQKIP